MTRPGVRLNGLHHRVEESKDDDVGRLLSPYVSLGSSVRLVAPQVGH